MVNSTCGVPMTEAASLKETVTAITSPAMKRPSEPCPTPESETPVTTGPIASAAAPFTAKFVASVIAWVPKPRAALLPAASRIVPPFSVSAEAPTEIPFASVSPAATA